MTVSNEPRPSEVPGSRQARRITVIGTFFGSWPAWFPALLVSCRWNAQVRWLFFTDAVPPATTIENVTFEPLTLDELNRRATERLGTPCRKTSYSQVDFRPAYGVLFAEHLEHCDFWGHCDMDVIWGDLRRYLPDSLLDDHDIVSFRKGFTAGHLTLWRNETGTNRLFESVRGYRDVLRASPYCGFDEALISTCLKTRMANGASSPRVYWPRQQVYWFSGQDSAAGWSWRNGRMFDAHGREHVYLHLQEAKSQFRETDFGTGDRPTAFVFSPPRIESRGATSTPPSARANSRAPSTSSWSRAWRDTSRLARTARRAAVTRDLAWATALADAGIAVERIHLDAPGTIRLTDLGWRLTDSQQPMLQAYSAGVRLVERASARFTNTNDGQMAIEVAGIRQVVTAPQDLFELDDLYVGGIYDRRFAGPTVVVEAGMGSGAGALCLARQPNVVLIGHEPSARVREGTLRNLALNADLAERIRVAPSGLGSMNLSTMAGFPPGRPSARQPGHSSDEGMGPEFDYEDIEVVDVAEVVRAVRDEFPRHQLVLKVTYPRSIYWIDGVTEGQLFDRLRETDLIASVRGIMGRWSSAGDAHQPASAEALSRDGFEVWVSRPWNGPHEVVHAAR